MWQGGFQPAQIERICQEGMLGSRGDRPTAIFATNGVTGLRTLKSLAALGLDTPRDYAFVCFDELNAEELFRPGITAVLQPAFEIGSRAVQVLLRRIRGSGVSGPLETVRLPATLVVRESSSEQIGGAGSRHRDRKRT